MRALFDVTHPALVHLFAPAAEALEAGGHDVTVAAREKDVTTDLLDAAGVPYAVVSHAGAGPLSDRRTSRTRDRSRSTCPPNRSGRGRESGRSSGGPRGPPRRCARGGVRRQRARATRRRPHAPVRGRGLYTFGIRPRRAESAPIRRVPRTRVPPPEPVHAGSGGAATTRRRPRVVVRRGSIRRVGRPPRPRPSRVLTSGEQQLVERLDEHGTVYVTAEGEPRRRWADPRSRSRRYTTCWRSRTVTWATRRRWRPRPRCSERPRCGRARSLATTT